MQKRKYKFPLFAVIIIFIIVYVSSVGLTGLAYFQLISSVMDKIDKQQEVNVKFSEYIKQAQKYNNERKDAEALKASEESLKYAENNVQKAQSYYWISLSEFWLENYESAKINAEKSISLDPKYPYAYDVLAGVSNKNKEFEKSKKYSEKLVAALPGYDQGFADLAEANFNLGNREEAIKNIKVAILLNPKAEYHKESLKYYEGETKNVATPQVNSIAAENKDPNYWKTQLGYMNDDKGKLNIITGNTKYNQEKIAQEKIWLDQRINIITPIYNKLVSGQALNSQDAQAIDNYWSITERYYALADEILSGK